MPETDTRRAAVRPAADAPGTASARGRLKIFFSYAHGAGKTSAMLRAARQARNGGTDVAVGLLAPGVPAETLALAAGLERLAPLPDGGFDVDGALARRPALLLVDELAHTNGPKSRHHRRYQEINELLNAGIDVYTTADVCSIEGLHDTVAAITGAPCPDRIPDSVFDGAAEVELVDVEPQELLARRREAAPAGSPALARLTALRALALRRCADRLNYRSDGGYRTGEHILACLSSAPSNARILRTASRMARAFHSQFTALFVETPDFSAALPEDKRRLQENRRLAEQLGATVETVYGEDVAYQIAEFARLSGVTRIVLGSSAVTHRGLLRQPALTDRLIAYVPETDIHIIPDSGSGRPFRHRARPQSSGVLRDIIKSVGILSGCTALSLLFYSLGFTNANIIMVYILGVLLTAAATSRQVYSLISSVASVFIFNYLFTTPRFSLTAYETGYPVTFVVMFLTAFITGSFASRYKEQARQSAKAAWRTKLLFDTDQLLSKAQTREEILSAAAAQVIKLLGRDLVLYEVDDGVLSPPRLYPASPGLREPYDEARERPTVEWVVKNNHAAGATTDTLSDAHYLYLALRVNERVYGVVGVQAQGAPLDASEHGILLSILGECALALENDRNAREKEKAMVLAQSEQLRANLLRMISHDLRTPLTTICGNASSLLSNGDSFDEATKRRLYADIYDDSLWLTNLVENLLSATRIEEGRMTLTTRPELLDEIVEEALRHVRRRAGSRPLEVASGSELLLVKADARLVVQVISNLVDNALKYTPPGAPIRIETLRRGSLAEVRVADGGPGIPDAEKEKVFDKFYCGGNKIADNRRSLGLGLYLCRAIVEAHGGTIRVADNQPHGAVFCFTLPLEEVPLNEQQDPDPCGGR